MKFQVILTNVTGKVETIAADAGRAVYQDAKDNPFIVAAALQSVPEFAAPITLERFTRH